MLKQKVLQPSWSPLRFQWNYTKEKLEKHTKTYNLLHFTAQIHANGSKTPTFIPFHIYYDYSSRLSVHFHVMNPETLLP